MQLFASDYSSGAWLDDRFAGRLINPVDEAAFKHINQRPGAGLGAVLPAKCSW